MTIERTGELIRVGDRWIVAAHVAAFGSSAGVSDRHAWVTFNGGGQVGLECAASELAQALKESPAPAAGVDVATIRDCADQLRTIQARLAAKVPPGHVNYLSKERAAEWAGVLAKEILGAIEGAK